MPFADAFTEASRGVKKFKQGEYAEIGKHPIVDQGQEAIAGYSDEEDGLFTNVPAIVFGDHTRCFKYVEEPFFVGADGVKILKPKLSSNVRFWWHALKATPIENLGYSRHFKLLKAANFYVFDSEQQEMVTSNLDAVLEQISQAEAQIEQLDQLVKSRFVEMFGDAQIGYKYRLQSLGSVLSTEPQNGLYKPQSFYVEKGGSPIVRVDAFQKGYIEDYSALKRLTCTSAELETYELVNNDIVINRVNGSIDRVGKIAWIRGLREPTVFESNMMRFHIDEKRMDLAFVTTYLNSDDIRQQIKACARIANQCSINQTNVANFVIPAPPLALQQQFASFVAQVDKSRFVVLNGKISRIQLISRRIAHRYSR